MAQVCNSHRFFIVLFMLFLLPTFFCFVVVFFHTNKIYSLLQSSSISSGAPNDDFLLYTLKTLFRLSKVLLDLQKYILKAELKNFHLFGDFESSWNYKGFRIIFPKNFLERENENFSGTSISITFLNPKILGFLLLRKTTFLGEWNVKNLSFRK